MQEQDTAFRRLDPLLQRWIHKLGWQNLLPIQKQAVSAILDTDHDVVISAPTAGGKTEAAFLPVLTKVSQIHKPGVRVLYISPLKALINDQFRRLTDMCAAMDLPVTPWHGDISASVKTSRLQMPAGVLLITPESLEAISILHPDLLRRASAGLDYVIVDEFHAFMGTERGYQLQSLLHRLENLAEHRIIRIALSATFSDASNVTNYLRPRSRRGTEIIAGTGFREDTLYVQIRGYEDESAASAPAETRENAEDDSYTAPAADIFRLMRGSMNLVFCNTRAAAEMLASRLKTLSEAEHVPLEFFPHHASLTTSLRQALEHRLQAGREPTTVICTSTLELGIDISNIQTVGQFGAPLSVSSLRQRLGRSGRKDHSAVLRLFVPDGTAADPSGGLYERTIQSIAIISLLLKNWYENPPQTSYAFSVLAHQTLSVLASTGGTSAGNLWKLLCGTGPFSLVTQEMYAELLQSLGNKNLIIQLHDDTLTLSTDGEKLVSGRNFFSVFKTTREYRILNHNHKHIGTSTLPGSMTVGMKFILAGRVWQVDDINHDDRVVLVSPSYGKATTLKAMNSFFDIHDRVRHEMLRIYKKRDIPLYLNTAARRHCEKGISYFRELGLDSKQVISAGGRILVFPWRGDKILRTMHMILKQHISSEVIGSHIEVLLNDLSDFRAALRKILDSEVQSSMKIADGHYQLTDKYDYLLPAPLLRLSYARDSLDVPGAMQTLYKIGAELQIMPKLPDSTSSADIITVPETTKRHKA